MSRPCETLRPEKPSRSLPPAPSPFPAAELPRVPGLHRDAVPAPGGKVHMEMGVFDASGACIPEIAPPPHLHEGQGMDRRPAHRLRTGFDPSCRPGDLARTAARRFRPFPAGKPRARLACGAASRHAPGLELQGTSQEGETARLKSWQKDILDLLGVRNPLILRRRSGPVRAPDHPRHRIPDSGLLSSGACRLPGDRSARAFAGPEALAVPLQARSAAEHLHPRGREPPRRPGLDDPASARAPDTRTDGPHRQRRTDRRRTRIRPPRHRPSG